ncbi:AEC family transporter [Streptococcus dentiloxodontae]
MTIAFLVFQKLVVLFSIMGLGLYLTHKEIFTKDVTLKLSKLLTTYVAPSLFVSSFISQKFSAERLFLLLTMIAAAFFLLFTRMILVKFLLADERNMDKYATLFANVGFMGTPLAEAVGGTNAVFFISGFVVANQIMQWTYGIYLISKGKAGINLRSVLVNPAMIATIIGLFLFSLPFDLPTVFTDAITTVAKLNTPLSTLVLGSYFYKVKFKDIFLYKPAYYTAFLRLFLTSFISIITIWILPISSYDVKLALTIASTSPTAMNAALLSQVYGGDYEYGSRLVLLTTVLSLISIPIMMTLADYLYL